MLQYGVKSVPDLLSLSERADFRGWTARDAVVVGAGDLQQVQEPLGVFILLGPLDVEGRRGERL